MDRKIRRGHVAALATFFVLFLAGRVAILLGGQVFTSWDSWVYAPQPDPDRNLGPLVSFIGHAPRPWGLPLFYSFFSDDHSRAVGQWVVGTLAWAGLAWELSRQLRTTTARLLACAATLLLGLMSTVASWDFAILTESISTSLGVVVVTLFLAWRRTAQTGYLIAMTLVAVWWTFIRPDIRLFILVLIALLVWRLMRARADRPTLRSQAPVITSALVLIGAIGWYAAVSPAMMEAFKPYDGDALPTNPLPLNEELYVHRLRTIVFTDPQLMETFHTKLNMPTCAATESFIDRSDWATVEFAQAYVDCPEMVAWGESHDHDLWKSFVLADPVTATKTYLQLSSYTLGGQIYATTPQVVPAIAERAVFPSRQHGLPITLAAIVAAVAFALVTRAHHGHARLFWTGVVVGATSVGSALVTVAMGTGEYARFGIQETIGSRVSVIILVCCALDMVVQRRNQPQVGTKA